MNWFLIIILRSSCLAASALVWFGQRLAQAFDGAAGSEEQAAEEGFRQKGHTLWGPLYIANVLQKGPTPSFSGFSVSHVLFFLFTNDQTLQGYHLYNLCGSSLKGQKWILFCFSSTFFTLLWMLFFFCRHRTLTHYWDHQKYCIFTFLQAPIQQNLLV